MRWEHPEWGVQSPANFIPLFEKNGFITKMDQYVWEKTCRVLQEWEDKGYPQIPVSVNVQGQIFLTQIYPYSPENRQKIRTAPFQAAFGDYRECNTETPSQIIDTVAHLREMGFVIEMDDFGAVILH